MAKKTFYFNTGVRPESGSPLYGRQVWKNGTKQIPFICENVPDNAIFWFACDSKDLPESSSKGVIVRAIVDHGPGGLLSQFAYFKTNERGKI